MLAYMLKVVGAGWPPSIVSQAMSKWPRALTHNTHVCSKLTHELSLKNRTPPPLTMLVVIYASRAFDQDVIHPKCPGIARYMALAV